MLNRNVTAIAGGLAAVVAARAAAHVIQKWWYTSKNSPNALLATKDDDGTATKLDEQYYLTEEQYAMTFNNQIAVAGVGFYLAQNAKTFASTMAASKISNKSAVTALASVAALTLCRGYIAPKINNLGIILGEKISKIFKIRNSDYMKNMYKAEYYISGGCYDKNRDRPRLYQDTCIQSQGVKYTVLALMTDYFGSGLLGAQVTAGFIKSNYDKGLNHPVLNLLNGLSLGMYSQTNGLTNTLATKLGGSALATFAAKTLQGGLIESFSKLTLKVRDDSGSFKNLGFDIAQVIAKTGMLVDFIIDKADSTFSIGRA